MTEPRALRRRKRVDADNVPVEVARWFAGERERIPWAASASPGNVLLRGQWSAWAKSHPGAQPPPGYAWIATPPPERMHGVPWDEALAIAKRLLLHPARPRRR